MTAFDFSSSFAGINSALGRLGQQNELAHQRQMLGNLGQQIKAGDYSGAAQSAFSAGDAGTAIGILGLGQKQQERDAERQFFNSLGGGGAAQPSAAPVALGNPNEIETRFVNTVKGAGLTNPVGLGAVAAYGKAESGFSPQNVNRTWSDPSESGQPGTAGGIMSWRADRLANLQAFARQRGEQQPSVETQALFLAQENPQLIPALQAAKTPQEANQIMANAWRFAGYDRPGGENARRLALTQGYAQRFGGQGGPAPAVPVQVAENEADVQRLEAQQGNPTVDAPGPVQAAEAAPQPGAPVAGMPAQGAAPAQGFAIPGTDTVVPQSLMNDPQVQRFSRLLMVAPTERARAAVKGQLDLAIKDAERRQAQTAPTEAVRNYRFYRQEEQAAGRTPMSFQQFRESTAARTTIKNEGTIPAGYRAVRDAQGNVERLEPIPGGEAATKAADAEKKVELQREQANTAGNVVLNAIGDIERLMDTSWFGAAGVAGPIGNRLSGMAGTNAHDAAAALETIGANISFQQLAQMRAASPTGGALGSVTEKELGMLQNAFSALRQSQSPDQFKSNLGRVRALYERTVHGRVLTPQERKSGGPMTIERARGLRDEAKAAIASGAPRDAVLKRLKDDYGIAGDGL